jgi:cell division protein FtsL
MNRNNNFILKVFFITAVIVLVVIVVGIMLNAKKEVDTNINGSNYINTITASSSVNADIDAYLKSSNSMPSSNDFNDSYADLSQ